jgi:hypothetical protein
MEEGIERRTFLGLATGLLGGGLTETRGQAPSAQERPLRRRTDVSIHGDGFVINGEPTYKGRKYNGRKVEGLLMNVRAVQAIFDDLNPETRSRWIYPDTKTWDPERNTNEFVAALPEWRRNGLLAISLNLQGGTPGGFGRGGARGGPGGPAGQIGTPPGGRGRGPARPLLENTAISPNGSLRPAYMARLARVIDKADELGMVVILGYFYFGQDQRVQDEASVRLAVVNATNWLFDRGYTNVLVEVNNECNEGYNHEILRPGRITELIELVRNTARNGRRFFVSTSWPGTDSRIGVRESPDTPATAAVTGASDFVLLHGNGPADTGVVSKMIRATRGFSTFRTMPVLINEDPNFNFNEPGNHLFTALDEYVSWGYYEQGQNNYQDGYQSPPVNWGINTENKRQFFAKVREITGA